MSSNLLNASEISSEPYIHTGYQPVNISTWKCIKYIFVFHNDWGNFWTHFVTFWMWLTWLNFKLYQLDLSDPFWYPFLILWIGGCLYVLGSSIVHAFAKNHLLGCTYYPWLTMLVSVCIRLDSVWFFTSLRDLVPIQLV